jgi:4'-phosphopantetheinyl transferase
MTVPRDRVVVWWSACVPKRENLTVLGSVLDAMEQERANRFRFERDRLRFVWRRVLRRKVLAAVTGQPLTALRFDSACRLCGNPEHGKPRLVEADPPCFSASQSGNITAIAVGDGELGLDVVRLQGDLSFIAEQALTNSEMRALPDAGRQRRQALALLWARKEAYLKAIGYGLSIEPADIDVLGSGISNGQAAWVATAFAVQEWWTASWMRPKSWAVAVSCERQKTVEFREIPAVSDIR